jgi:predicted dehydrogenase
VHYLDLTRYFTGRTPVRVKATTTSVPGQVAVSPMIFSVLLEYAPEARVMSTVHFNNIVRAREAHRQEWFLDGTEGSAWASAEELTLARGPDERQSIPIEGTWFPEAFGGSMGELLTALAEGREPATSGRDNLDTIRIALAAVESSQTGRAVELSPE